MLQADKKSKNYTEGTIWRNLLQLAIPIILANTLQSAYQLIDTFWLGRMGAHAVAAVSLSFPVFFLILSVGAGITIATTVMVSQSKGSNNQRMVDYSSSQSILVIFLISVSLSVLGYYTARPLMTLVGAGPEILEESIRYFQVSSLGFVFLFMFFTFQSLMRGIGNVWLPMYIVLLTVFLNLILDPLFIFGYGPIPAFGVAGAAWASVFTQGISALIGLWILFRGKRGIHIRIRDMNPDLTYVRRLFNIGIPSSMDQSTRAAGLTVMVMLVTSFGSDVVAAYGVGARILSFVIIPALGLSIATTTLVGQNVGAGKIRRAEKTGNLSSKIAFFSLTSVGMLMFAFAHQILAFFVPNDPKVIEDGAKFIRIMAPSFGLLGVQQSMTGVFNGAGFTLASMLISILNLWIIRFPLAYILSNNTSLESEGIYWAFPISNLLAATTAYIYYKSGKWKEKARQSKEELDEMDR